MLLKLSKMITLFFFFFFFFLEFSSLPYLVLNMIFFTILLFSYFWSYLGQVWFMIMFFLLFLGGVLVVFMTLTSLYPNTKNFLFIFNKKLYVVFFFSFMFCCSLNNLWTVNSFKFLMVTGGNFYMMLFLVLLYFFCFLYYVSKDSFSLRVFF